MNPGSIPPFGSLFGLPTLCDRRLGENEVITQTVNATTGLAPVER